MARNRLEQIRVGSAVACSDGHLGIVERIEDDERGAARLLMVSGGLTGSLAIPIELVREVDKDGAVLLECDRNGLRNRLDSGGASLAESATVSLRQDAAARAADRPDEVLVRTWVDEAPSRLEVEAFREEVEIEHVLVGQVVTERSAPWEEDGVLIVPVYEEQLVVTKRLVLREQIRLRQVGTVETRLFEDTLRRDRLSVEDRAGNRRPLREKYPPDEGEPAAKTQSLASAGQARRRFLGLRRD